MGEGSIVSELLLERLNYCIYVILLMIGLWAMLAKQNLIKKLIGMSIFQTAIILFYVSIAVKEEATIPIYLPEHDPHAGHSQAHGDHNASDDSEHSHGPKVLDPKTIKGYANPLPHVLMLTAIVVGVATLGLALALTQRIYQGYGTIEEDELLEKLDLADERASLSPLINSKRNAERRKKVKQAKAMTSSSSVSKKAKAGTSSTAKVSKKKSPSDSSQPSAKKGAKKKA
jgi:multicomponent Na+:H+ antiporter subunit C